MNRPWPHTSQSALAAIVAAEEELFLIEMWIHPGSGRTKDREFLEVDPQMTERSLIRDIASGEIAGTHIHRIIKIRPGDFHSANVTEDIARAVLAYAKDRSVGEELPYGVRSFVHEHIGTGACE